MATDYKQYTNRLPKNRKNRPIRDSTSPQWVCLICAAILTVPFFFFGKTITGLLVFVLGIFGAWGFPRGPGFMYPVFWFRKIKNRIQKGQAYKGEQSRSVFPFRVFDFVGRFGTLYNKQRKTDRVYFMLGGYNAAFADVPDRYDADTAVNEAVKAAISQTMYDIGYGWIAGERPYDPTSWAMKVDKYMIHGDYHAENDGDIMTQLRQQDRQAFMDYMRKVLDGEDGIELTPEQSTTVLYDELEERWENVSEDSSTYFRIVYLNIRRPSEWRKITKHPDRFNAEGLSNSTLVKVFTALEDRLRRSGFKTVQLMSYDDVREFIFRMGNVHTVMQAEVAGRPFHLKDNLLPNGQSTPWAIDDVRIDENQLLVIDGNYHAILRTKRFGRDFVLPGGLTYLLTGNPTWTMTLFSADTKSSRFDTTLLRVGEKFRKGFQRTFSPGTTTEQQQRDLEFEAAEEVNEIYRSRSKPIRFNHSRMVSATTPEGALAALAQLESILRRDGIAYQRVKGPFLIEEYSRILGGK